MYQVTGEKGLDSNAMIPNIELSSDPIIDRRCVHDMG